MGRWPLKNLQKLQKFSLVMAGSFIEGSISFF
jgi:hypothetical protein